MNKKIFVLSQSLLVVFFTVMLAISAYATISKIPTLDNLNKALKGETNASHKYELFAQKADEEGYPQVAKLFRAVSMAESIHKNNHKGVILGLGGKPEIISYDSVEVQSTKENLQGPIKGETYEKEVMYPSFIKQANIDRLPSAVRTFTYAQEAEKQHERLFADALNNLGNNADVDYCVSRISGATYAKGPKSRCPIARCGITEEYIRVK